MTTEVTTSPRARVVGDQAIVPVTFRLPNALVPDARRVAVRGSFNGWRSDAHLLRYADGEWRTTIYLSPSEIVYYFDVDGVPWLDPDDDGRVPNGWGSEYSVRRVGEATQAASAARLGDQLTLL
jgi:1,4-alpha-glucan branching enzyme